MELSPQTIAKYYREILSLLGKSAQSAISNLVGSKSNALIADLSYFPNAEKFLFDLDTLTIKNPEIDDEVVQRLLIKNAIREERENDEASEHEEQEEEPLTSKGQKEQSAILKTIWSKSATGKGDRESYYGFPLLCGKYNGKAKVSPLFIFEVDIAFNPEKNEFKLSKIQDSPAINWNILSELCKDDDERAALYEGLNKFLIEGISSTEVNSFIKQLSALIDCCKYIRSEPINLTEQYSKARERGRLDIFSVSNTPILINAKKAHLYLVKDLEALASGKAQIRGNAVIKEFLKEYAVGEKQENNNVSVTDTTFLDLCFPLVTNNEQVFAARFAEKSRITVIEGPPGTGKSHTIVNLINHLVAQGKSVLMTSQKTQALKVIKDRMEKLGLEDVVLGALKGDAASKLELLNRIKNVRSNGQDSGDSYVNLTREQKRRLKLKNDILYLEKIFAEVRQVQHDNFEKAFNYAEVSEFDKISRHDEIPEGKDEFIAQALMEYKNTYIRSIEAINILEKKSGKAGANFDELVRMAHEFISNATEAIGMREELSEKPYWKAFSSLICNEEITSDIINALNEWWRSSASDFKTSIGELGEDINITHLWDFADKLDMPILDVIITELNSNNELLQTVFKTSPYKDFLTIPPDKTNLLQVRGHAKTIYEGFKSFWKWMFKREIRDGRRYLSNVLNLPLTRNNAFENITKCRQWCDHWETKYFILDRCNEAASILNKSNCITKVNDPIPVLTEKTEELKYFALCMKTVKCISAIPEAEDIGKLLLTIIKKASQKELPVLQKFIFDLLVFIRNRELASELGRNSNVMGTWPEWADDALSLLFQETISQESQANFYKFKQVLGKYDDYLRIHELRNGILSTLPGTLKHVRSDVDSNNIDDVNWCDKAESAVKAHRLKMLLEILDGKMPATPQVISKKINQLYENLKESSVKYVMALLKDIAAKVLADIGSRRQVADLESFLQKKAGSFSKIREQIDFTPLLKVLPCWIMNIDDVARIFPLKEELFDYVIIDEASQCNQATILHLLYRAKNIIVVGDEKQLGPAEIRFLRPTDIRALMEKYGLANSNLGDQFDPRRSLLQLSGYFSHKNVRLKEHFRSVPEIITWSNDRFYNGDLIILTPDRGKQFSPPLEVKVIEGVEDPESRINVAEANHIIEIIKSMINSREYDDLTIGVISPFRPQADYINALIVQSFPQGTLHQYALHADTADGFQGDERDIIIYSFRQAYNSHQGSVTTIQSDQGRVNVMFTRARRKAIAVTSIPMEKFPEGGAGKTSFRDYLIYCDGIARNHRADIHPDDKFDSDFEREVCTLLRKNYGLDVKTQVPVPGIPSSRKYHIDMVVRDAEGRRLAVECDGPQHFDEYGEQLIDDIWRQLYIERTMGIEFYRIPSTRWYREKEKVLAELIEVLRDQETEEHRTVGSSIVDHDESEPPGMSVEIESPEVSYTEGVIKKGAGDKTVEQTDLFPIVPVSSPKDPKIWFKLSHWGKETGKIDGYYRVFAFNMGKKLKYGWEISPKQKDLMKRFWKTALTKGFKS